MHGAKKVLRLVFLVLVLVALVGFIWKLVAPHGGVPEGVEVGEVTHQLVEEVVSETGYVESVRSVDLAFRTTGSVSEVLVEEGAQVTAGEVLATLDTAKQLEELSAALARLTAEESRLAELRAGSDELSETVADTSVAAAELALTQAEERLVLVTEQQANLVQSAKDALLSTNLTALLVSEQREGTRHTYAAPTITGTYTGAATGTIQLELYASGAESNTSVRVSGLISGTYPVSTVAPVALGDSGLYLQFPEDFAPRTEWEIAVPNVRSSQYVTLSNAYNTALETERKAVSDASQAVTAAQVALAQAQAQQAVTTAPARSEQINAQEALVTQMRASVRQAEAMMKDTRIVAPFDGVVTDMTVELGQVVAPGTSVGTLLVDDAFELKVHVSEIDIAELSVGDTAMVTFDAYEDMRVAAEVTYVAQYVTTVEGVRVVPVTLAFLSASERIIDGLSAEIDILTAQKESVLAVPTRAIYEDEDGKFVYGVESNARFTRIPIVTGLRGTNGLTEITEGLSEGTRIVMFAEEEALLLLAE